MLIAIINKLFVRQFQYTTVGRMSYNDRGYIYISLPRQVRIAQIGGTFCVPHNRYGVNVWL